MSPIAQTPATMLIEKLIERQRSERKSDAAFAATLGVTRTWWNLARNGRATIGDKPLSRIVLHYPELGPEVLAFLRDKAATEATATTGDAA